MDKREEQIYIQGSNQAYLSILMECLRHLGINDLTEARRIAWVAERTATVAVLRRLCNLFGDNEWNDNLHLADIIEKHLGRYLEEYLGKYPVERKE